jgi:hypothetical protein
LETTVAQQQIPENDPIVSKSYAFHYLIATVILIGTLFWAMWDEAVGQRPWKEYQGEFSKRYIAFLNRAQSDSAGALKEITASSDYQELDAAAKSANDAAREAQKPLQKQIADVDNQIAVVQAVYTDAKARIGADTYDVETGTFDSESARVEQKKHASQLADLDKEKQKKQYEIDLPSERGKKYSYNELEEKYLGLKQQKADLVSQLADVLKPAKEAEAKRDQYISDHMVALSPAQLAGLKKKYGEWDPKIVQINVAEANIVDRCESCHMGTREPLTLTPANLMAKGAKNPDSYARAFITHPEPDLLKIHDPEKFGCSPCHNGNGRATTSIEKAHGNYEHWLWPLYRTKLTRAKDETGNGYVEAGCQTCHAADRILSVGDIGQMITDGKDLFRVRGCNGCHRYQGYDREPEELTNIGQQIKQFETEQKDNLKQAAYLRKQADSAQTNEEANHLNQRAEALVVANSKMAGQIEQLDLRSKSLLRDMKKIGPNLKEVRAKLNPNWIPVWLTRPTDFRPTTKMPNFRLTDEQVKDISAFIWQNGLKDSIDKAQPGDTARGKDLFENRGCLACHSMGEGEEKEGGVFAANLSREGEKANYDYIVRWVENPRHRIRPYCPYEKKDIGPEDYAKKGQPYVFDLDHSTCPNDGHELQVQQMTVMPILRLTHQEAQDIASYLMTKKQKDASSYPDASSFMNDPQRATEGKKWVRHYGCAGCHEISGFEEEGRIGTELTAEGSKPIERLDFALLTHTAETGGKEPIEDKDVQQRLPSGPMNNRDWYNLPEFFEHKLAMPNIYDKGKVKSPTEALRMPDPHLSRSQVQSLVTFLIGSQESSLPASYQYKPEDARHDIQEGWWIVKKYNCQGCHQFYEGQHVNIDMSSPTILETLPQFKDTREKLPPKLLTEGARVDPEWLMRFLSNPALSTTDINRNGVRPYLQVRMPTFNFSPDELRKLVRFFQALSQQPLPYTPQKLAALSPKEVEMGRSLFSSQAAPCLKCHATGDPNHDKTATAPNFLLAKDRLKPGWVQRWITDPQSISPGTAMPSGLFKKQGEHWVFNGPTPPTFQGYEQDHNALLMRYIMQLTPEEQRAVAGRVGRTPAPSGAKTGRVQPKGHSANGGK